MSSSQSRRKSSFFYRHKIAGDEDAETSNAMQTVKIGNDKSMKVKMERERIISKQIADMQNEISEWKKKLLETKSKHGDVDQYKNNIIDWTQCKDCLTENDVAMLTTKPNYQEQILRMSNLAESVEVIKTKLSVTDNKIEVFLKVGHRNILQMKENLCNFLLSCEESSDAINYKGNSDCCMYN